MSKYGVILEALKNKRDNPNINELYEPKKGDRFKLLDDNLGKFGIPGDVLMVHSVPIDSRVEKESVVLARLKRDGTIISILGKGNWIGSSVEKLKSLVDTGKLLLIKSEEDLKKGDIPYTDIKDIVKNLELDKLFSKAIPKLVMSSGRYYRIYIGEDDTQKQIIYRKLGLALDRRGIKYDEITDFKNTRYLAIDKIQI